MYRRHLSRRNVQVVEVPLFEVPVQSLDDDHSRKVDRIHIHAVVFEYQPNYIGGNMLDGQKQQTIKSYDRIRGKLIGTAALGIPMYKATGEVRHFTGTNREVNAFKRSLNESEHEAGVSWDIREAS